MKVILTLRIQTINSEGTQWFRTVWQNTAFGEIDDWISGWYHSEKAAVDSGVANLISVASRYWMVFRPKDRTVWVGRLAHRYKLVPGILNSENVGDSIGYVNLTVWPGVDLDMADDGDHLKFVGE